jgi:hypothetical protein
MTHQRDIERLLDQWFSDGPDQAPDRVVDIVTDRIERQSQRPAWRLQWRLSPVNAYAKITVAAAAVLIVALVGYNFFPGGSTGVGAPASPVPSRSPAASASPSPAPSSAVFPPWFTTSNGSGGAGILPAGNVMTRAFAPGFAFTVPEGWVNSGDELGFYGLFPDTLANQGEFAASGAFAHEIGIGLQDSPYLVCDAWEDNRGASAEMVASMVANDALATSEPIDVTIGGLTGKQIDVRLDPAWTESCPGDPPTYDLGDTRGRAILLDSPDHGVIVILVTSLHSAGHEAFLAEAMPIVESIRFDVGPGASPS